MKSKIILRIILLTSLIAILSNFIYIIGDYNKQVTEYTCAYPFIILVIVLNCLYFIWTFAKKSKPNAFMYIVLGIFVLLNFMVPSYKVTTMTLDGEHPEPDKAVIETTSKNMYGFKSWIK